MIGNPRAILAGALTVVLLGAILAVFGASDSQASGLVTSTPLGVVTQIQSPADVEAPAVSSFSNSPTCYRQAAGSGVCYIEWSYLYTSASSGSYIISMTVTIDDRLRAYHAGFFQTAMYVPSDFYGTGFKVTCGIPGSGGVPGMGRTYAYTIRARETGGGVTSNTGAVVCPADEIKIHLPLIQKP
ncbi:MAG: hypothetical protein QME21_16990 [Anaerolineales bacterium]|jgi:hypothetical protein|nr:hypothetical protein [Anaerolineales bacterium]